MDWGLSSSRLLVQVAPVQILTTLTSTWEVVLSRVVVVGDVVYVQARLLLLDLLQLLCHGAGGLILDLQVGLGLRR